jgi:hypothetical protein
MAVPLVLQVQEAALDSKLSVTDALRKAKIICSKLDLVEFAKWIDDELEGYMNKSVSELPEYRKLYGIPKAYSQYQGWQPIILRTTQQLQNLSFAPIGMSISAIEASLAGAEAEGEFHFPYPPEAQQRLMKSLNWGPSQTAIALSIPQVANIIDSVRNILLTWTIDMEKQGVLGKDMVFTAEERAKSVAVTEKAVSNTAIHIGQVGTFVQSVDNSIVQGQAGRDFNLINSVRDILQQTEQLLPAANLPQEVREAALTAMKELNQEASGPSPEDSRLKKGLETLRRVLAPAGENLLRIAVDAAVGKLIGPG